MLILQTTQNLPLQSYKFKWDKQDLLLPTFMWNALTEVCWDFLTTKKRVKLKQQERKEQRMLKKMTDKDGIWLKGR